MIQKDMTLVVSKGGLRVLPLFGFPIGLTRISMKMKAAVVVSVKHKRKWTHWYVKEVNGTWQPAIVIRRVEIRDRRSVSTAASR